MMLAMIFFCSSVSCGDNFSWNFQGMNTSSFFMNSLYIFAVSSRFIALKKAIFRWFNRFPHTFIYLFVFCFFFFFVPYAFSFVWVSPIFRR